ncbi:RNA-dependent RNA polymerase 6 [Telopea speciosissima]|uniref:RNA-dependent RNA polymerase 6 n=1 Tax=Telopea speciosissima TaxID=54955 RepID=UPI001CC71AEA|nr:RNA-dependent RNA polymerase 6 [Telopea speciosissima]
MGSEGTQKDMVVTQVSFGGFDRSISAKGLTDFLENEIGLIWRCRLKASWTPPESHPNFEITNMEDIQITLDYDKVEPHAFVHFASPDSATAALNAVGRSDLMLNKKSLRVNLGPESPFRINQRRRTTNPFKFSDVRVDVGTLVSRDEFFVGWKGPIYGVDLLVDPFDGTCKVCFTKETAFSFKGTTNHAVIKCDFKVEFMVREITHIKQYADTSSLIILLQLISSPCVYYRTADDNIYESVPFDMLDDEDPWIRTTDFTPSGVIGRCNSYRFSISPRFGRKLNEAVDYLKGQRIPYEHPRQSLRIKKEPNFGVPMSDSFFCIHHKDGVSFETMFLVNAIMHKGVMNQHQLSNEFFDLLRMQTREVNVTALKHICSYKHPVFDAYKSLKLVQAWLLKDPKLLLLKSFKGSNDNAEVRRLVITPTKSYCLPPEVELSNRVLRKYKEVADRFLRVTFMDEGFQQLNSNVLSYYVAPIVRDITSNSFLQRTTVFKRVKAILTDGFNLCGRKYSFLAFSSNQLRDRSAWFFAEDKSIRVDDIKSWMGKFTNKNVAKCAARMGLCFSSTYATVEVPIKHVNPDLPDIERNGYVFSDGIGMLTPDLAMEVAEKLQLTAYPPCAYQIRYAGCKGVIACWPEKEDGIRLSVRPSMNKFESTHTILEVVSWTRFQPGYLNRQFVTLLSALGVPDNVFSRMQDSMVYKLNQMLENTDVAFDVLTSSCAEQGNTAAMMLSAGFKPQTEPHLKGMLSCIRAAQLGDLLAKARIFVPSGRWLMGCLDEIGVLEQGQCFIQVSTPSLENCFLKHGSRFSETKRNLEVIKGTVAIAKNPCLHPGDVRILEAVDVPVLHHLFDCLVFPQKGDRPHTNEASGSDLDGDLYFVTWDENLLPPSKTSWLPMDYFPVETKKLPRAVNHTDIIDFFLKNMVTENLGVICNAHVVHADQSEYGALDEKCLRLAELAATAVDFPKTGKLVTMPPALKPKMYPDFMGKIESQSYKSTKILGKLYRKIKDASEEVPISMELICATEEIPYDADLEIPGSADFLEDAWSHKLTYDGQLSALLRQYKVNREEEVVTGHIWSMPKHSSKKQGDLKERLKHAYNALKKEFRQIFENMGPDSQKLTDDEKNTAYEQKASAWYQVTYHPRWVKEAPQLRECEGENLSSMLSFAWIPANYLVCIKIRRRGVKNVDATKPINSLAKYLVERM